MAQQDGLVGVINGIIKIVDPLEGGNRALLIPPDEGATIFVNGLELEGPLFCELQDIITIQPTTYLEESRVEVKVSPDGLYAMAAVFPRIINTYRLDDADLRHALKPFFIKQETIEKAITLEHLEQGLRRNNIIAELNVATMMELVRDANGEFKTVAEGKAVEEGADGSLEYRINPDVEVISYENEAEKANYREKYRYPAVKRGDIIAVIHPPREGKSGQKVTGEAIIPKPVKEVRVRCGEGVMPHNNQGEIVALKDGRLIVSGSNIRVTNLLVHNGDVNIETGNLRFNGAIRIFGNVMEGMLVEAHDSITIEGSCYGAVLKAGGEISVKKNLIQCEVQGGLFYDLLREVFVLVGQLTEDLKSFINKVKQLLERFAEKGQEINEEFLKRVFSVLIEKNAGLQDKLIMLQRKLANNDYAYLDDTLRALKRFEDILSLKAQGNNDPEDFMNMAETFNGLLKDYKDVLAKIPPFTASYVQNCILRHSGDIKISGSGCYFSSLQAGGEVIVTGAFRGGNIRAEGNVRVKEFISITTTAESIDKKSAIRVKVSERAAIFFGLAHEDTTVQIGKMVYRFDRDCAKIMVRYDPQEGLLKLTNY
ncbi:MAG TPA: hypothetical protein DCQ14_06520 [Firmicutes bacterium]|nr:hypothetical protein [Bacillota bacterium]